MEKPTKKIPHEISPASDPDLTPDDDNPINPNETTPPKVKIKPEGGIIMNEDPRNPLGRPKEPQQDPRKSEKDPVNPKDPIQPQDEPKRPGR